ncbi:MAG: helix-turn-helix domain-containing protein [Candidatus Ornithomonoglobus sp.]
MKNSPKQIGQRIREIRKARQLSQTELANLLGKSLRTVQKYEKGEIEAPISVINEIAAKLGTTSNYLIGYEQDGINLESIADICTFLFKLEQKLGIKFDIDVKKPKTDGEWKCSISFDGQDKNADINSQLCLFLEEYAGYKENFEQYIISRNSYNQWQDRTTAYYAQCPLTDEKIDELTEDERSNRRNEMIKKLE